MESMKKIFLKIAAFLATFIISAIIISTFVNRDTAEVTVKMAEASLPTVSTVYDGHEINLMHGYTGDMEKNMLRDALSPLESDRTISLVIHTYGNTIKKIGYEVRSANAERLVENTELGENQFEEKNGDIVLKLQIKDLIENDVEYLLGITLHDELGRQIYFSTRIMYDEKLHRAELLKFVKDFSEATFDKTKAKGIVTYMESNSAGDNSTYAHVDIHSSFDQITWGTLGVSAPGTVYTKIYDMDASTATIERQYVLTLNENNSSNFYDVTEVYRVRYTNNRIYLLDFQRDMHVIFNPESKNIWGTNTVYFGITDPNLNMKESDDGSVIAFVQNGSLYAYRAADSRAIRIFSFFGKGDDDIRNRFDEHDIKILSVDETGNVQFMVYGYMNRGRHEGEVGISVYFFNSAKNRMQEQVYIPYARSFEILKSDISRLAYTGGGNSLSLYMDGSILRVDLSTATVETIAEGLKYNSIVVSDDNRLAAWKSEDENGTVQLVNLSTGKKSEISKGENAEVTPLGFIGEDFVYGVAYTADYIRNSSGIVVRPMNTIYIEDSDGKVLKEYKENNIYITRAYVEDSEVILKRIRMEAGSGSYSSVSDDEIVNNFPSEKSKNVITQAVTDTSETVIEITLAQKIKSGVHVVNPEEVMDGDGRSITIPLDVLPDLYYVYAAGHIKSIWTTEYEAVISADASAGIVVDSEQNYIWKKGDRKTEANLSRVEAVAAEDGKSTLAASLEALLRNAGSTVNVSSLLENGNTAMDIIEKQIPDSKALNLAGCSLSSVLYYVSDGIPVIATGGNGETVLIVGYDAQNTILMDPTTGTIYKKGMNDSTAWFAEHGNEFVTYVKKSE